MITALPGVRDDVGKVLGADHHGDAGRTALDRERVALPADAGVDMQQVVPARPKPSRHGVRIVVEPFNGNAETGGPLKQG